MATGQGSASRKAKAPAAERECQAAGAGLFAVLGELTATADWHAIAEEIWPFVLGPASTPIGEAERAWRSRRPLRAELTP